ncbi:MAG: hypothetical protein PWP54_1383 [Thermosipho sp. (in: thermotogales)]|nr:hypothetical protein [Thermosipho sp. (in: thermotogales)]MDK2901071.1 hypothetical protein [Thermosipho sp. (in: thermotogales)]
MYANILENNLDDFIELLKLDEISLEEAIISYLKAKEVEGKEKAFYEIVKKMYLKQEKRIPEEILSKFFKGNSEIIFDIYKNGFVEAKFPIVSENEGKIARVLVVKSKKSFTNVDVNLEKMNIIEKIVRHSLSLIFDSNFVGNSYMLAAAIAGLTSKIPKNLAFTGELDEKGYVKKNLENYSKKEEICTDNNLKLISAYDIESVYELKDFFEEEKFHVPVLIFFKNSDKEYINFSYENLQKVIAKKYSLKFLELFEKVYDIKKVYTNNKELSKIDEWQDALKESRKLLIEIISHGGIPHVSIVGPSAMAMALGIAIGVQNPIVIYHRQYHEQVDYFPVIDLTDNLRKIKNIKNTYKHLKHSIFGEGDDCSYVIYLASHNPIGTVRKFLEKNSISTKIILIEPKENKGNLDIKNWEEIVSELMSITQNNYNLENFHCENIHFFLSCPVAISFAFGMAFGDFAKGSIYHYDKENDSYLEVFRIENIRRDI